MAGRGGGGVGIERGVCPIHRNGRSARGRCRNDSCAPDPGRSGPGGGAARAWTRTAHLERSEEHTSELQSLMRISYAVFCLKKKKIQNIKETLINRKDQYNTE